MIDAGEVIKSSAFDKLADIIHKLAGPTLERCFGVVNRHVVCWFPFPVTHFLRTQVLASNNSSRFFAFNKRS